MENNLWLDQDIITVSTSPVQWGLWPPGRHLFQSGNREPMPRSGWSNCLQQSAVFALLIVPKDLKSWPRDTPFSAPGANPASKRRFLPSFQWLHGNNSVWRSVMITVIYLLSHLQENDEVGLACSGSEGPNDVQRGGNSYNWGGP